MYLRMESRNSRLSSSSHLWLIRENRLSRKLGDLLTKGENPMRVDGCWLFFGVEHSHVCSLESGNIYDL
jgi:hypothetical protein